MNYEVTRIRLRPRRSSRNAGKDQLRFWQLKGACSWTQGTKIDMSHQPPMTQREKKKKKKADDLGISIW